MSLFTILQLDFETVQKGVFFLLLLKKKIKYLTSYTITRVQLSTVLSIILSLVSLMGIVCINGLTLILKIIAQCDVKHIMTLPMKILMSVLKIH